MIRQTVGFRLILFLRNNQRSAQPERLSVNECCQKAYRNQWEHHRSTTEAHNFATPGVASFTPRPASRNCSRDSLPVKLLDPAEAAKPEVAKSCVAQCYRLLPDAFSPLSEDSRDSAQRDVSPVFRQCGQNPTVEAHSVRKREKTFDGVQCIDSCTLDIHVRDPAKQLPMVAILLASNTAG